MVVPRNHAFEQFRALAEISRALTYAVTVEEVLRLVARGAHELLGAERAVLMLTNADGMLSIRASHGLDAAATERFREPVGDSLIDRLQALLGVTAERVLAVPLVVSGHVTGMLAVRVELEPEPERAHQELLLSALGDQAAVAIEKASLDEAARYRERVVGIVSHDLRGPIASIIMGAGVMQRRGLLDETDARLVALLRAGAERADRMIRDLLGYSQAHLGGGIPVRPKPCLLGELIRRSINEHLHTDPARSIEYRERGELDGIWDPDRLVQLIGNLLTNALAYSPPDSVVWVDAVGSEEGAVVEIRNEGTAIALERLPTLFDPPRIGAESSLSGSSRASLGLYIVKQIAAAHAGTIRATSSPEDGTVFTLTLPRTTAAAAR